MLNTAFCQLLALWSGPLAIQKVSTSRMASMTWARVGTGTGWAAVAGTAELSRMDATVLRAIATPRARMVLPNPRPMTTLDIRRSVRECQRRFPSHAQRARSQRGAEPDDLRGEPRAGSRRRTRSRTGAVNMWR